MRAERRLFLAGLLFLAACAPGSQAPKDAAGRALEPLGITTSTGPHAFMVEIADDEPERQRGLMFRPPLADDRGMLFEFPVEEEQGFWMKNTPSPLDIVYVSGDGHIVSIAAHATPFSEVTLPSYGAAKGVIEFRAGRMEEIGAKAGDVVHHPFFGS
ncbi:DUF192 domain-containing protein [soil metagenome]